jgi:predicted aconitase with swiveling domain
VRNWTAPAAILTSHVDPIIGLGAILGDELQGDHPATLVIAEEDRARITAGDLVSIDEQGWITVETTSAPHAG